MARLTEKRLKAIEEQFATYQAALERSGRFDFQTLEADLRRILDCGYTDLKLCVPRLLKKRPALRFPILYWMQHNNATGPQAGFKETLARAYGIKSYDHHGGTQLAGRFWETFPQHRGSGLRPEASDG